MLRGRGLAELENVNEAFVAGLFARIIIIKVSRDIFDTVFAADLALGTFLHGTDIEWKIFRNSRQMTNRRRRSEDGRFYYSALHWPRSQEGT